jgi:hypothetical protein
MVLAIHWNKLLQRSGVRIVVDGKWRGRVILICSFLLSEIDTFRLKSRLIAIHTKTNT